MPDTVLSRQTLLRVISEGIQPDANANDLTKQALRRMGRYHVLNQTDGQHTFDIPLIQRWVRDRAISA